MVTTDKGPEFIGFLTCTYHTSSIYPSRRHGGIHSDRYTLSPPEEEPLLIDANASDMITHETSLGLARSEAEAKRGHVFAMVSLAVLCFTWIFYLGTAYLKLATGFVLRR